MILSSPEATRDIGPAAMGLRPPFDGSNICRRRGPLKLMSKLISEPKKLRGLDALDLTRRWGRRIRFFDSFLIGT